MDAPAPSRFRLTVQYDGSAFHGWQVQPDQRTVQGEIEKAASRLADAATSVIGSGRTDTGVHATGQVCSVDMPTKWTADGLRTSLNALLPSDVWVCHSAAAAPDFHPRYDAIRRTYRYEVGTKEEAASPFHRSWCWPLGDPLDPDALASAAAKVVGAHRFERFAKAGQPERGYDCTVHSAHWSETPIGFRFEVAADRYLHHMVRYLVGTMVDVARGRRPLHEMTRLLVCEPEAVTSPPAPPGGLFLHRVDYPGDGGASA